jgi:ATP-binding cassette subfamily F protein uup
VRRADRILQRFDGTLLLVSHDRALLDGVTNRTLALEGGGTLALFDGPYGQYHEARQAATTGAGLGNAAVKAPAGRGGDNGARRPAAPAPAAMPASMNAHQLSKERQRVARRVAALEAEVEALETRLAAVEAGLSSPRSADDALALAAEHAQVGETLAARLSDWESATLEAEALGAAS